jgi:hypothetical protein
VVQRISGGVTYPRERGQKQEDPSLLDRLKGGLRELGKWWDQ